MSDSVNVALFDPVTLVDPYDAYKTLRDEEPVHFVPAMNLHVVTRYDLLREAIKDTQTYSSKFDRFMATTQEMQFASAPPETQQRLIELNAQMVELPPTMLTLDEPEHTQYRSLVSRLFTGSQIKRSQDQVQTVIDGCLENLLERPTADFMERFAFPVPLRIIADRLGIPEANREFFDTAATAAAAGLRLMPLTRWITRNC